MKISSRGGAELAFTEARWGRFTRSLAELEGWLGRLRSDFGSPAADFVVRHRLIETEAALSADVEAALRTIEPNGHEVSVLDGSDGDVRLKIVELATSAAGFVTLPADLLVSPVYAGLRRSYGKLAEIVGAPPFELSLGKKSLHAETFEALRGRALELAKEGIQVSRFKGLGEMNADELRETTMDPAKRMLVRVEVEDATLADEIFSKLMGDQVEPRRAFIEQNARDVRFLDV
jgi:DNA gyrase subunit B